MICLPAVDLAAAARCRWDVIVIGAGPAGSLAAFHAAGHGLRTLLLDAKSFPRRKVCGGCLNHRAIAILSRSNLAHVLSRTSAAPYHELQLHVGQRTARFALPPGWVISRERFDEAMVNSAIQAGAALLENARASVAPTCDVDGRQVSVADGNDVAALVARVVIVADGLSRSSVKRLPEFATSVAHCARVGLGTVIDANPSTPAGGQIAMVVGRHGYVGLARSSATRLNIAAACDPCVLTRASLGGGIADMLDESGVPVPAGLAQAIWTGTPPLTSRPGRVASERLFLIGDAAGYVEPFTGDGMATALETAAAVIPLVEQAAAGWQASFAAEWSSLHRRIVRGRQLTCEHVAWMLRRPWAAASAVAFCRAAPQFARLLVAKVN
jgi:flavin-dependent dehydrogenase